MQAGFMDGLDGATHAVLREGEGAGHLARASIWEMAGIARFSVHSDFGHLLNVPLSPNG